MNLPPKNERGCSNCRWYYEERKDIEEYCLDCEADRIERWEPVGGWPKPAASPWNNNPAEAPKDGTRILADFGGDRLVVVLWSDHYQHWWMPGNCYDHRCLIRFAILNLEGKP